MRLRMRKASQQSNPSLESRPSRTKRKHSEVEEDPPTPTSGGRGIFSTIKKFIRGNAVKVTTSLITSNDPAFKLTWMQIWVWVFFWEHWGIFVAVFGLKVLPFGVFSTMFSWWLSSIPCFLVHSVMFPEKCLEECSSLSENPDSVLILASCSQSVCRNRRQEQVVKSTLSKTDVSSGKRMGLFWSFYMIFLFHGPPCIYLLGHHLRSVAYCCWCFIVSLFIVK